MPIWITLAALVAVEGSTIVPWKALPAAAHAKPAALQLQRRSQANWFAESPNFIVRSLTQQVRAGDVADACESHRGVVLKDWFGQTIGPSWGHKCEVVLHPSRNSYLQAVGSAGSQTLGSSLVRFDRGCRVARMDLLVQDGGVPALKHELIHIICSHHFAEKLPPRWAEEGLAVLHDPAEKRARHARDLTAAFETGAIIPLESLFASDYYPTGPQRAAFYAQSASLVGFLVDCDTREDYIRFIDLSLRQGYESALQQAYHISSVAELQRQWRMHALVALSTAQH